jgi:pyruvate dehydrogenase E1 component beta subunit
MMQLSGLKVVIPSTPADAKGLMTASIRDPNPVVYFLELVLAGTKGEVPAGSFEIPLGQGDVKRSGNDVTLVAIGSAVPAGLAAADELAQEGISAEVIDPRTLVPLDWPLVSASIEKTGHLVVLDPARRTCGAGGEIIARAVEENWSDLRAAPCRVTWEDVPMPFSPPLEEAVTLTSSKIKAAVVSTLEGGVATSLASPA